MNFHLKVVLLVGLLIGATHIDSYGQFNKLKEKAKKATQGITKKKNQSDDGGKKKSKKGGGGLLARFSPEYRQFIDDKNDLLQQLIHNPTSVELAKKLDYPNTYKTLVQKGNPGSGSSGKDYSYWYKTLRSFQENGQYKSDNFLQTSIEHADRAYNTAYEAKGKNQQGTAVKYMKEAKQYMEVLILLLPNNPQVQKANKYISAGYEEVYINHMKDVITSDFHEQNVGKVLFSKEPIIIGKEKPEQFVTEFGSSDKVYAVAYFDAKIIELAYYKGTAGFRFQVNDSWKEFEYHIYPEYYEKAYTLIEIMPDPNKSMHISNAMDWFGVLGSLSPREHTITNLEFKVSDRTLATCGNITLKWTGANSQKLKANAELAVKNAEENYSKKRPLPEQFSREVEHFKDPRMNHANIRKLFMAREKNCASIFRVHTDVREDKNGGDDWEIVTNDYDLPLGKRVNGLISVTFKGKDGHCYYSEYLILHQKYLGGGRYGPVIMSAHDDPQRITCDKAQGK